MADPELHDGPKEDLHSLRARDVTLNELSDQIQRSAAARAAAAFGETADLASLRGLLQDRPVLITGSAGYLGLALHLTLRKLGVSVIGVDVVPGETVDSIADVADAEAMRRCGQACGAVFHTAALHAPHASSWHARDFTATNVVGTTNVLALGLPTVHTSTTSLTISPRVKQREKAGELVWLDEQSQRPDLTTTGGDGDGSGDAYDEALDAPRNKYGRTKLEAEQRCLAAAAAKRDGDGDGDGDGAGVAVVVLRAPRFFPEDPIVGSEERALPLPNVKANELLGRRCGLADLIDAHLRALARIRLVRGMLLTVAAPWPLARPPDGAPSSSSPSSSSSAVAAHDAAVELRARFPRAERLFARHGWRLPDRVTRVYDSDAAVRALGWQPHVTFEALLRVMEEAEAAEEAEVEKGEAPEGGAKSIGTATADLVLEELLCGKY